MINLQLFLRDATGRTVVIGHEHHIKPDSLILQLKQAIKSCLGHDINNQRLVFAGKEINNDKADTLMVKDYGIQNDSTIFCLLRLPGGGSQKSKPQKSQSVALVNQQKNKEQSTAETQSQAQMETTASMISSRGQVPRKEVKVRIMDSGKTKCELLVDQNLTVYQVKQAIYASGYRNLEATAMDLIYNGMTLVNGQKLSYYNINNCKLLPMIQTKASLKAISSIIASDIPDEITLQSVTARMPCGHRMGTGAMTALIRSLIDSKEYKIKCPYFRQDDTPCSCEWEYKLCAKIGVLTLQEKQQFEVGLSENWLLYNGYTCPKCHAWLLKPEDGSRRVKCHYCPVANRVEFCIVCLKPWQIKVSKMQCGNIECNEFKKRKLLQCPTKKFTLDQGTTQLGVDVPNTRMCPWCTAVIQHTSGCKHMKCGYCSKSFCFVCLKKKQADKNWPCGGVSNYCGLVAPRQEP